jgi:hypothetical protein
MVREGRILWDNPSFGRSELDHLRRLDRGEDCFSKPIRKARPKSAPAKISRQRGGAEPKPSRGKGVTGVNARQSAIASRTEAKRHNQNSES